MKLKLRSAVLLSCLVGTSSMAVSAVAHAAETAPNLLKIKDIQVRGLQRLPVSQIFGALPFTQGDTVSPEQISESIHDLFQLGTVNDVQVFRDGPADETVLSIQVQERPSISGIDIEGNKLIETDVLMDALKQSGLTVGSVMQRATLERMKTELERQYVSQGRYGALVVAKTIPKTRNRVDIELQISEGEVAKIKDINILGNHIFDNETLIDELTLKPTHFWSFIKGDDKYAREKLTGDLERLRSFYFDRGYVKFDIEDTQVAIDDNRENIYITVHVTEGEQHTVGKVDVRGILPIDEKEIRDLILIKPGQTFSRSLLTLSQDAITKRLGMDGYTFAEVQANPVVDEDSTVLDVTFFVNPGKRVYVNRIHFEGSVSTKEEVYRRELRQMEGAWAESGKIELSKSRLERLAYVKHVEVETVRVPGYDDQIDLVFKLEEQPSGSIGANIGYGGSGFQFGVNYNESNFLGTGDSIDLVASRNTDRTSLRLTHRDPHFTVDGVSRGYSLLYQKTDYEGTQVTSYRTDQLGAKANYGYPISEQARLDFGFGYDTTEVYAFPESADEVKEFIGADLNSTEIQSESFDTFSVEGSWYLNKLNRGLMPDRGSSHYLSLEIGLPGSDNPYYLSRYEWHNYIPVSDDFTFHTRFELGYGDGYGNSSSDGMPFYKHFFAGGIQSVRGYDSRSLGPKDTEGLDSFGGNMLVESSIELILPMPFVEDQRAWRSVVFFDAGNVFNINRQQSDYTTGEDPSSVMDIDPSELRLSAGIAFTWITPIGPLSLSYANPFNYSDSDELEKFQFSIGQVF
ncbi:MAG: outer membrane protein assembly factor BamA [Pseudomonadota bacterium]|nr:outer membrane protein assembly factor BamA [Gammaproteobacteria bacterium]MEC8012009.1 outer membrane protein assembly factor BamA [Pseudomonadota bacterium]HBF09818.1 outer membrane protein assembly factor BamA [Gammaproteobacteria bacterium]